MFTSHATRLVMALAFALFAIAGCIGSSAGGVQAAAQNGATQPPAQAATGAVDSANASQLLIWRIAAAAKAAAAGPHGGIGDAAVATTP